MTDAKDPKQAAREAIKAWLDQQGIPMKDFAKDLEYDYQHVAGMLNGSRPLSDAFIGRILKVYGTSPVVVLSETQPSA